MLEGRWWRSTEDCAVITLLFYFLYIRLPINLLLTSQSVLESVVGGSGKVRLIISFNKLVREKNQNVLHRVHFVWC